MHISVPYSTVRGSLKNRKLATDLLEFLDARRPVSVGISQWNNLVVTRVNTRSVPGMVQFDVDGLEGERQTELLEGANKVRDSPLFLSWPYYITPMTPHPYELLWDGQGVRNCHITFIIVVRLTFPLFVFYLWDFLISSLPLCSLHPLPTPCFLSLGIGSNHSTGISEWPILWVNSHQQGIAYNNIHSYIILLFLRY